MAEKEYYMPKKESESEFTDRKSVFLGHLRPVESEEQAMAFVAEMKKKYIDARHNVWAYTLHDGGMRSSDDGEPSGTGGAPVLDSMLKRGITDCVIVVTRYFGGILLGTGGLVHAYSAAASSALDLSEKVRVIDYKKFSLVCGYDLYGSVSRLLEKCRAREISGEFLEKITVSFLLPPDTEEMFSKELTERSCGKLKAEFCGKVPVKLDVV